MFSGSFLTCLPEYATKYENSNYFRQQFSIRKSLSWSIFVFTSSFICYFHSKILLRIWVLRNARYSNSIYFNLIQQILNTSNFYNYVYCIAWTITMLTLVLLVSQASYTTIQLPLSGGSAAYIYLSLGIGNEYCCVVVDPLYST